MMRAASSHRQLYMLRKIDGNETKRALVRIQIIHVQTSALVVSCFVMTVMTWKKG